MVDDMQTQIDIITGMWRRKINKEPIEETEITSNEYYTRGQRIQ